MAFRDGPFENLKVPVAWTAAGAAAVAIGAAVMLLLADSGSARAQTNNPVRSGFEATVGPVNGVFAWPVRFVGQVSDNVRGYFFAVSENRRLKRRIAELEPWRDQAIALKTINARYEAMLGVRTEPPVPLATGRSISDSRGPYANARLIDVGSARGVRIGNPVITEHGLVGRVIGTSSNVSRVLLLTDVASQTPIMVDRTDARAILKGDGSGNPRLEFIRGENPVQVGDRILTSGDGGGIPRGIPVGMAAKGVDGSWRVKLFNDRGPIDYVRVMLFQDFGQLTNPEALNAPPLAGFNTAPPPDLGAAPAARPTPAQPAAAPAARATTAPRPAATPPAGAPR